MARNRRKHSRTDAAPQPTPTPAQPTQLQRTAIRMDSLINPITGFGIVGADRRMGARYDLRQPLVLDQQYWLYKQTWLAAVICECVPQHCARAWFDIVIPDNPEASLKLQKAVDKYRSNFRWAATLANMTGGCLLAMGIDDGTDPVQPIDYAKVRRLVWMRDFDRWYAYPSARVEDPQSDRFGEPMTYSVFGTALVYVNDPKVKALGQFDASRVLRFDGNPLPVLLRQSNQGWNDSVLERVYDALRDFNQGTDAGAKTLTDFTMTIMKIVGLSQDVLATGGDGLNQRIGSLSQTMATAGVMAVDQSEDVERIGHKLAGFKDVLDTLGEQVAGASGIPRAILYGQATGTTRAGADTDVRSFYDRVQDTLVSDWEPKVRHLCRVLLATKEFKALNIDADDLEIEPRSLWQEEPETSAKIMKLQADSLVALNGTGALTVEQTHRAAVEIMDAVGMEVDDGLLASAGAPVPEDLPDAEKDATNPTAQYVGAMPPLAGRSGLGMPIIPGVDSNAAGGA